jgi:TRAP-type mannitol/chloroaromatic compound transport system permease small subunit
MLKIIQRIDEFNDLIGRSISWLTLVMVTVTFLVVVLRYVFSSGWIAMQESVIYLHSIVIMLGAAYTLKQNAHVRVDIFYERMIPRNKAWVDLFGTVFLLIPFCLFIFYISWNYVSLSWSLLESSRDAGGLPAVFLLKTTIPVMAALLMLQAIAQGLRSILIIRGQHIESFVAMDDKLNNV